MRSATLSAGAAFDNSDGGARDEGANVQHGTAVQALPAKGGPHRQGTLARSTILAISKKLICSRLSKCKSDLRVCYPRQPVKAIAAVAYTPGGADHLMVEEVEVAPPKAHEVRLKVVLLARFQ